MEGSHEEGGVGRLGILYRCVVEDFILFVLRIGDKLFEFTDVLPGFAQVEGPEVHIEGLVLQILNNDWGTWSMLK